MSIYSLEEVSSDGALPPYTTSWWSSRGLSAMLRPLPSEEGSLDGGLRQGCRALCTWAERDVLQPGQVYVLKAFRPEVLAVWQRYFHGCAALQLCLRVSSSEGTKPEDSHLQPAPLTRLKEIQQQRAAQKLMQVFNRIKPRDMHPSPRYVPARSCSASS